MLERWTNPYLIFVLAVVSIVFSIVGTHWTIRLCVNVIFFLTMLLITFRDLSKRGNRVLCRNFNFFLLLIVIAILFDFFYYSHWFPNLNVVFLVVAGLIKVSIFGCGWLSMVILLGNRQKVTGRTIILAITAYLFIGIIWSFIYFTFWQINPHAFHISVTRDYELTPWNLSMYFSLITLTTVGYGDIIPVDRWLMVLANFEAITGLIYITVIVARLVSLYSTVD